jgi:hypothetical protein
VMPVTKHVLVHPGRSWLQSLENLVLVDSQKHKDGDDDQRDDVPLYSRKSACVQEASDA